MRKEVVHCSWKWQSGPGRCLRWKGPVGQHEPVGFMGVCVCVKQCDVPLYSETWQALILLRTTLFLCVFWGRHNLQGKHHTLALYRSGRGTRWRQTWGLTPHLMAQWKRSLWEKCMVMSLTRSNLISVTCTLDRPANLLIQIWGAGDSRLAGNILSHRSFMQV